MYTVFRNFSYYTKVADLFKGPFNAYIFASSSIEKKLPLNWFCGKVYLVYEKKNSILRLKQLKAYY